MVEDGTCGREIRGGGGRLGGPGGRRRVVDVDISGVGGIGSEEVESVVVLAQVAGKVLTGVGTFEMSRGQLRAVGKGRAEPINIRSSGGRQGRSVNSWEYITRSALNVHLPCEKHILDQGETPKLTSSVPPRTYKFHAVSLSIFQVAGNRSSQK